MRNWYRRNHNIRNGRLTRLYLFCLRRRWKILSRLFGLAIGCEIRCPVPERLFLPHPNGIVVGGRTRISNDVVIMQQVTLGCRSAYGGVLANDGDPIVEKGAYLGPGAKILGNIRIGAWSIVGANAVVTKTVPARSVVVGHNKIIGQNPDRSSPIIHTLYARYLWNHQRFSE